ncbi:MAG: hypothetical protein JWO00_395 [Candidatus Parcubacteria bacterium]|nr:hypothetical protein [Candidatus Parcubacteria bacterium]
MKLVLVCRKIMNTITKLVRDHIPALLVARHVPHKIRVAGPMEYRCALVKKLHEELEEFDALHSLEELADIMEVIEALKKLPEYWGIEEYRHQKMLEKGGFSNRIILSSEAA